VRKTATKAVLASDSRGKSSRGKGAGMRKERGVKVKMLFVFFSKQNIGTKFLLFLVKG
jgi:hypothetical protein